MKSLMRYCINWGKHKHPKKLKNGEEIPLWPVGKELEKLNEICKKCDHRFFELEGKECAVCGSIQLSPYPDLPKILPTSIKIKGWAEKFFYKCDNCGTKLYSFKKN